MSLAAFSIGIVFMGLVCTFVGGTALGLVLFLRRRWSRLDLTMRSYTWFWWFTSLVWLFSGLRYLLAGLGVTGSEINHLDVVVQAAVFFTGPPLFYYATMKVTSREDLARATTFASFLLGVAAVWFVLQPHGVPVRDVTFFSAEATVNLRSFSIFSFEAAIILFLLLYDIVNHLMTWRRTKNQGEFYSALFSVSVGIYLLLGTIDESKVITDWPLVVFRLLYSGAFLFVYLVIVQAEAVQEKYLFSETDGLPTYD